MRRYIKEPKKQHSRLYGTGLAILAKTREILDMCMWSALREAVGQVSGRVRDRADLSLLSESRALVGDLVPLLTLRISMTPEEYECALRWGSESGGLGGDQMLNSVSLIYLLSLFVFRKLKSILRRRTFHMTKQEGMKMLCGTRNIIMLDYNDRTPFGAGWLPINGSSDWCLTMIISRSSGTESQPFIINNTAHELQVMLQGHIPTKWFHLSPQFNTCTSSPTFQHSIHVR